MNFHVARQPIFNRKLQVYGYELLYRNSTTENFYVSPPHAEGDAASYNVIINSFYNIGIESMTAGRKAFVNFTGNLLSQEIATLLPSDSLVVEVLETVTPTPEILEHCQSLKRLGYEIALDDFVLNEETSELLKLADIVKIDFLQTPLNTVAYILQHHRRPGLRFLAEKIETRELYEKACQMGFTLFQGYFFSKPIIVSGEAMHPLPINCLRLMQIVNQPDFSFNDVSRIIMQDVTLSYQLLKLVNSVAFGHTAKIKTVQHALVSMGIIEVRKWVSLVSMMGLSKGQPKEIYRISLIRAKFCEYVSNAAGLGEAVTLFMTGLFSLMDVITSRTFDLIFRDIAVDEITRSALVDKEGLGGDFIALAVSYERGDWDAMEAVAQGMNMNSDIAADAYREAVRWCNDIIGSGE